MPCQEKCYATKAWKMYLNVREAWERNWDAYEDNPMGYFEAVAQYCIDNKVERFRWHVAGDIPDKAYFGGMKLVARVLPETQFLCFTKRVDRVTVARPDNLRVVISMWPKLDLCGQDINHIREDYPVAWFSPKSGLSGDEAYDRWLVAKQHESLECTGKCDECFMCWYLPPGSSVRFEEH